jgi:hypothetical protein
LEKIFFFMLKQIGYQHHESSKKSGVTSIETFNCRRDSGGNPVYRCIGGARGQPGKLHKCNTMTCDAGSTGRQRPAGALKNPPVAFLQYCCKIATNQTSRSVERPAWIKYPGQF